MISRAANAQSRSTGTFQPGIRTRSCFSRRNCAAKGNERAPRPDLPVARRHRVSDDQDAKRSRHMRSVSMGGIFPPKRFARDVRQERSCILRASKPRFGRSRSQRSVRRRMTRPWAAHRKIFVAVQSLVLVACSAEREGNSSGAPEGGEANAPTGSGGLDTPSGAGSPATGGISGTGRGAERRRNGRRAERRRDGLLRRQRGRRGRQHRWSVGRRRLGYGRVGRVGHKCLVHGGRRQLELGGCVSMRRHDDRIRRRGREQWWNMDRRPRGQHRVQRYGYVVRHPGGDRQPHRGANHERERARSGLRFDLAERSRQRRFLHDPQRLRHDDGDGQRYWRQSSNLCPRPAAYRYPERDHCRRSALWDVLPRRR